MMPPPFSACCFAPPLAFLHELLLRLPLACQPSFIAAVCCRHDARHYACRFAAAATLLPLSRHATPPFRHAMPLLMSRFRCRAGAAAAAAPPLMACRL